MATLASASTPRPARIFPPRENRFFAIMAVVMAMVVVAAFSFQFAMGRSTLHSPPRVHLHAIAFMGWTALFVAQSTFASRGSMALHRRLGWFSLGWMALMVIAAAWVIVAIARNGTVPFFFLPQQFLIGDPMTLVAFVGLTSGAITMRRRTDWHARLHVSAMAALMGPAFGRLLPMPLMTPYALEIADLAGLVFPIWGMIFDIRRRRRVHSAWWIGAAAIVSTVLLSDAIAYSPLGGAIYRGVTAGSPGAAIDPLAFPAPPASGPVTGR